MSTILFYDPRFPYAGKRPDNDTLMQLSGRMAVTAADTLAEALDNGQADCLVMVHGSYFPRQAWGALLAFLRQGGGLVHAGGAPFKIPVAEQEGEWIPGHEMTAYHQQLHIHEALEVDPAPIQRLEASTELPLFAGKEALLEVKPTCGLVLHVSKSRDIPQESGSNGPMDAAIYPLLKGISAEGREVAAPAVLLEHRSGDYAGGRWLLINQQLGAAFWTLEGIAALEEWAGFCGRGATEMALKTGYAAYKPGETAELRVELQDIRRSGYPQTGGSGEWSFRITLASEGYGGALWNAELQLRAGPDKAFASLQIPVAVKPGLYRLTAEAVSAAGERRRLHQGYWGQDEELLRAGTPLTRGRDYFRKDGRPFPVVGMTYMTSDVSRKFLFMPNPALWDKDMKTMKAAGINWLRTGLWTAWRNIGFADGHASEEVLRAVDAFIMTAKRHGLEVTFTFFAFTPEAWEGVNPYLDPRSIEAQKRFILAVAARHRRTSNVNWDFINEPSLFDPGRIFTGPRTLNDRFERKAYSEWLAARHGSVHELQDRWNMTPEQLPDYAAALPPEREEISFDIENMRLPGKHNRWLDYTLFTMEMFNRWVRELAASLKTAVPDHLITVGQDEGLGRGPRPSPFFYAGEVDYTTVHTWWLNDALVWDSVFAKAVDKPCLVQETGIMYVEHPDNRAKRSEGELRNILERKYAYAFAAGGAGAIQWLWNTNYYMNNVNESNIGALRADGTEKPEADVSYHFGGFMQRIAELFEERVLEETVVVFPYSNDFSSRPLALEATTRAARVLGYELKIPYRGLGEYQLESLEEYPPRLIIVPSPHNFSDEALDTLAGHVRCHGGTLLISGPLGLDAYWKPTARLSELTGGRRLGNVLREEALDIGGTIHPVSYGGKRIGEVSKETGEGTVPEPAVLQRFPIGKGELMWCPLPLELNERSEAVRALYEEAAAVSGLSLPMKWISGGDLPGVYGTRLSFRDGALFIFVSEYACDAGIEVEDSGSGRRYRFLLEKERSVLFAVDGEGKVRESYRGLVIEERAAAASPESSKTAEPKAEPHNI
ncbi:beta-galactosidase [Paenibacillus sp. S150]|uniref:beta-galactosidase n=1 Tax=Paenibacillus sp. S150 TaxID=2749826 RepID=UPI001C592B72|nr:beta-galactosidase [Paenibacillus sp. S150]MBW4080158.1 beta-galactosidase [Paenibacillus sp. S150]